MNTHENTQPPKRRTPIKQKPPVVMGIDASLTGTAIYVNGKSYKIGTEDKGTRKTARLRELAHKTLEILAEEKPDLVVLEGYSFGSKSLAHSIGEWGGVLKCLLWGSNADTLLIVPPQTLKKFVIGHAKAGESGKDVMILKIFQNWGVEFTDNDKADAYALYQFGKAYIDKENQTKVRQECIKKAEVEPLS